MITEKGTLIVGVEYDGKRHKEFTLRPQLVRDSIEAMEDDRARTNESYLGLIVLSKQLVCVGDIPPDKISPAILMDMHATDMEVVNDALRRLQERLKSFRGEGETAEKDNPGADETGLPAGRDQGHA